MANPEHLAILERGVDEWNAWRKKSSQLPDLTRADLKGTELASANLCDAILIEAELHNANLFEADLIGADLSGSKLNFANFYGAILGNANLTKSELLATQLIHADLSDTNFCEADFSVTNLTGSDLRGANFTNAGLGLTIFGRCDLSEVIGLESIHHWGPCSLGLDTIYASNGKIPESFLRGCGVPESFITQMRSLVNAEDGIQFYSCFISHSTKDAEFATRLHGKMRDAHLRVWYAPEDMPGGKKLHEEIETAIRVYDKLLIVLSEASLESEWVKTELRRAFKEERASGKRKLFPVRLTEMERIKEWSCFDADSGKDLGVELREYFIPDFSHWKEHDQFEASFARLLKDLKADERAR